MILNYQLEATEIEESLLCLDYKREGKWKYVNAFGLECVIVLCLVSYIIRREEAVFLLMAGAALLLLFYILYVPGLKRKRKAKKMAAGGYRVKFPLEHMDNGYESERVFTIQKGQDIYCIPKRILEDEQMQELRNAEKDTGKIKRVITGG